jgi:hypothetical protein
MCDSIDCPITYARVQATRDVEDLRGVEGVLETIINERGEMDGDAIAGENEEKPFWQALEW